MEWQTPYTVGKPSTSSCHPTLQKAKDLLQTGSRADLAINSCTLCQLSYRGIYRGFFGDVLRRVHGDAAADDGAEARGGERGGGGGGGTLQGMRDKWEAEIQLEEITRMPPKEDWERTKNVVLYTTALAVTVLTVVCGSVYVVLRLARKS